MTGVAAADKPGNCTLWQFTCYFIRLGSFGFGGPIALTGAMQRDLVESRAWITKQQFADGLALAQLMPGPLAAQLAMYLGWVRGRVLGATIVGFAFILPSFLIVLGLSWLYLRFGGLPWLQHAFYGVGAAVIAMIARSAWKLTNLTLKADRILWGFFIINAAVTGWTESESAFVFVGTGLLNILIRRFPEAPAQSAWILLPMQSDWLWTGSLGAATVDTLGRIVIYFGEAGAFVFGSGLAIVPFLHHGVVEQYHWLSERQFMDAVAVAMLTPGPVVITTAFIGYIVAGPVGAALAALATFLPCYCFTVLPAPWFEKFRNNLHLRAFVEGVTAAATGAIAGAVFVLAKRGIQDAPTALIAVSTFAAIYYIKKVPDPLWLAAAGAVGWMFSR
ncbi:MAG: chromate transporter [Planctomycetes bacterium]|nr:chromate transporter [Planctomycetota bacterium]